MHVTAKGMIENFLSMVERYGFVPNGGRVYYLSRSQPPLLIPMVCRYGQQDAYFAPATAQVDTSHRYPAVNEFLLPSNNFCFLNQLLEKFGVHLSLYLTRMLPFIRQVAKYYETKHDRDFLKKNILLLETEFEYWQNEKTVNVTKNGKIYKMAHYVVNSRGPRPESYK